jgi:ribosome-associated toxin RatA of RatAB toxin-antitoxin module
MAGKLANLAFGTVFNQICNTMVGAFTQRAKDVYGY